MKGVSENKFNTLYWLASTLVFVIVALRCYFIPFSHDEVATFYFYIQPGSFIPFLAHVDANGHFLTNFTGWISYKLVGSSPFALRLPALLSFIILCFAVFQFTKLFTKSFTKVLFSFFFIFSYNFIAFYALCRGYGISMAFLLLALYYFFKCFRNFSQTHFLYFLLFSQIALSANLTLVFVLLVTTGMLMLVQLKGRMLFNIKNLFVLLVHFSLIAFWVKYAFFLQKSGALYYGQGDSYWEMTFVTLIDMMILKSSLANIVLICLFAVMMVYFVTNLQQQKTTYLFTSNFAISCLNLVTLIAAFYLLKKLLNVNYPADRTGLFFYVFFALSFSFMIDELITALRYGALIVPVFFGVHFILNFDLKNHPWVNYETFPQRFMDKLVSEQQKSAYPITVAGHRLREFIYGFMNYNNSYKLNHITAPEALQMNCDYAIAYGADKPFYDAYYTELDREPKWDFRLLKRKVSIEKKLVYQTWQTQHFNGNYEYYNACDIKDTTFADENPLLAEFNFTVEEICVPFNAWLVLQMDDGNGGNFYVRAPLNLIKKNWWETDNFTTCLVSANIPKKIKRMAAYLWNIDKKDIKIRINSFKLYQLFGEGVTKTSKAII